MRVLQIDGSNLYHGLRLFRGGLRVDFGALRKRFQPDRALYYNVPGPGMGKFLAAVKAAGFELRLGHLRSSPGGRREKGVDVLLAVDMVTLAAQGASEIVLVSGDEDLVPAVQEARRLGARVVAASFQGTLARRLAEAVDDVVLLDAFPWDALAYAG